MAIANESIAVIGAGIVGASTALYLRRAGRDVTIFDALPPGSGASFGNAGMISPDFCVPASVPGMLRKVPGWLRDPLGPLAIRPAYLPKVLPWLVKWAAAGRLERVLAGSDALRTLHVPALDRYRELLGPAFNTHIRTNGQIYYWEGGTATKQPIRDLVWARHGVVAEPLALPELYQIAPALTRAATQAVLLPKNGHTVSPQKLVQAIAGLFLESGGSLQHERVEKLLREEDGYLVVTNVANYRFSKVIIAAGAWSQRLLSPLGIKLPLETERGYHVFIPNPNVQLPSMPIICTNKPAGVSPIDGGIRAAGTVEFAGLDAPMNEARAVVMLRRAKQILPAISIDNYSIWMGHRPSFPDSLPVIGPIPGNPNLILAFGHGHSGMTGGPTTARAIMELVAGKTPSIDLKPFSPARFN